MTTKFGKTTIIKTTDFVVAKTKIEGEWSSIINKLEKCVFFNCDDYDLQNSVTGIAIKSESGKIHDLLVTKKPELPENYSLTILYEHPKIKKLIDFFELETTRIRIFKQQSGISTKLHLDYNNVLATNKNEFLIRIWMALNYDKNFTYIFREGEASIKNIKLKTGESVIFNPDTVQHGAINSSFNKVRYSLNIIGRPNPWLKNFIEKEKIIKINNEY